MFGKLAGNGVTLTNAAASAVPIAEFVMAQVLMAFHPVAQRLEAQRLQKLVQEQQRQRKKTLDELAMLDDDTFYAEQSRASELSAQKSAAQAHGGVNGTQKKKRTLLSRVLPFGLLRGTFRSGGRSDYL